MEAATAARASFLERRFAIRERGSAMPAFFIIAGVPLTFSIAAGIGFGVFAYVAVMVARGRWRDVHPLMYALVPLFGMYYASGWLSSHVFT